MNNTNNTNKSVNGSPRVVILDGPNMIYAAYNGAKLSEEQRGTIYTARRIKMVNGKPYLLRKSEQGAWVNEELEKAIAAGEEAVDCPTGAVSFMLRKIKQILDYYDYNVKLYVAWDKPGSKDWVNLIIKEMNAQLGGEEETPFDIAEVIESEVLSPEEWARSVADAIVTGDYSKTTIKDPVKLNLIGTMIAELGGVEKWVEKIVELAESEEGKKYKAGRARMDDALRAQIPILETMIRAIGGINIGGARAEADHWIGAMAKIARENNVHATIVSQDKDLAQWISDTCEIIPSQGRGRTKLEDLIRRQNYVEKEFGVAPHQIPDLLALAGDSVDNIPGIPGVGKKTAAALIGKFGDIETLLEEVEALINKFGEDNKKIAKEIGIRGLAEKGIQALRENMKALEYYKEMTRLDLETGKCMQGVTEMAEVAQTLKTEADAAFRQAGKVEPKTWQILLEATGINPRYAPDINKMATTIASCSVSNNIEGGHNGHGERRALGNSFTTPAYGNKTPQGRVK